MSEHDHIGEALDQLQAHGLVLTRDAFKLDGQRHRCFAEGHRSGVPKKDKGWWIANEITLNDGVTQVVVGVYGNSYHDCDGHQKIRIKAKLSDSERQRLKERSEVLRKEFDTTRAQEAENARQRAENMWPRLPDAGRSAYLQRKCVGGYGVRYAKGQSVVVPVRTIDRTLVGLQFIAADGGKLFLRGTPKQGAFHLISSNADLPYEDIDKLCFAEGYATAATVHAATGLPVVVCFDAGNLWHVIRAWRDLRPVADFLVCADNDHETKGNPGVSKARRAAIEYRCRMAVPQFADAAGQSDFNDLYVAEGIAAVQAQLDAALFVEVADDAPESGALPMPDEGGRGGMEPPKNREQPADAPPPDDGEGDWNKELSFKDYQLRPMVHNVRIVMWNHPALSGLFGFDEFQQRVVKLRVPPWGGELGPVNDVDEIEAAAWFGRPDTYACNISTGMAREAMLAVARQRTFHPVRDYLNQCAERWDGEERLPMFFSDYCDAARDEVHQAFALNFFISAVARIFRPGVKADLMLVLEGDQGIRKSTLFNSLCGDKWFLDLGTPPSDKDFYQLIQGRWIVEIGELASFAKSDSSHIKRALSARADVFRPAYGRNPVECPRQCVFAGTVNNSTWQRDETGGRRYMPVLLREINAPLIADYRDQFWGEAVTRFRRGETWWELPASAADVQADRYEDDVWGGRIVRWLDGKFDAEHYRTKKASKILETTVAEILNRCLWIEAKKQDKAAQTRVGTVLLRLGWKKKQKRVGQLRVSLYLRPEDAGASAPAPAEPVGAEAGADE